MAAPEQTGIIDYQKNWSGELRRDPDTGNAFVLRQLGRTFDGYTVMINDIFGNQQWMIDLDEWLTWKRVNL